jgi:uncharacterized delta-60 repeat protein
VTFPLGRAGRHDGVDARGLAVGIGLPGGGVVLGGIERSGRIVLAQLHADGSLDPAFGSGGIARAGAATLGAQSLQLLRRPDGRLLVVAATAGTSTVDFDRFVLMALGGDGTLDPAFGTGGVASPALQWGCGNCSPAALDSDGSIVLTGQDGSALAEHHWVAARLTPTGSLDTGFGQQGVATLPGTSATGYASAALPGGAVAILGHDSSGPKLARLTAAGALDPAFNGGLPVTIADGRLGWFGIRARADGSVDALGSNLGVAQLVRYTPSGGVDPSFGKGGVVTLTAGNGPTQLLPAPDGGDLVAGPAWVGASLQTPVLRAARVTGGGVVASATDVPIAFGGGNATVFAAHREPTVIALGQTGFSPGRAIAREDGSLVLPGAIGVVQYTGEGVGYEIDQAAVAAVTPAFALDPSFGGPAQPAEISVRVARQRASTATDVRLLRVAVGARASGPGLCLLRVTAGGRVIARSTAPVFSTGPQRLRALLTTAGRRYLRRHAHHVRVTVTATFRDLVGARASARALGTLR